MFRITRLPRWSLVTLLFLLSVLAFLYIGADLPHHSRWIDDSSRYTDDGWYAGGAIRHALTGRWLLPGDFNAMVPVPLWPLLLGGVFHFTGVSVDAARIVAICFGVATVVLGGALVRYRHPRLAIVFMLLVASNPLYFYFSRAALVEPSLLFLIVASLWAAQTSVHEQEGVAPQPRRGRLVLCGVLFSVATIDKATAVFVLPVVGYLVCFPYRRNWRQALRVLAVPGTIFVISQVLYLLLWIRPHEADFALYARLNPPVLNLHSVEKFIRLFYRGFTWTDPLLFPVMVAGVLFSITRLRGVLRDPLFVSSVLFTAGYMFFMLVHVDAGPHYFTVIVFPTMLTLVLLLEYLQQERVLRWARRLDAVLLLAVVLNLGLIVRYMLHPNYSRLEASRHIEQQIDSAAGVPRLIIGHATMETTFYTGILPLDDMGTQPVIDKLNLYHPGWAVLYNADFGLMQQPGVPAQYRFVPVGSYVTFDQGNNLHLFRIEHK